MRNVNILRDDDRREWGDNGGRPVPQLPPPVHPTDEVDARIACACGVIFVALVCVFAGFAIHAFATVNP